MTGTGHTVKNISKENHINRELKMTHGHVIIILVVDSNIFISSIIMVKFKLSYHFKTKAYYGKTWGSKQDNHDKSNVEISNIRVVVLNINDENFKKSLIFPLVSQCLFFYVNMTGNINGCINGLGYKNIKSRCPLFKRVFK